VVCNVKCVISVCCLCFLACFIVVWPTFVVGVPLLFLHVIWTRSEINPDDDDNNDDDYLENKLTEYSPV